MFNFEKLHKNHKWAFVEGLLCGLVIGWIINLWRDAVETLTEPPGTRENAPEEPNNTYYLSDYAEQR